MALTSRHLLLQRLYLRYSRFARGMTLGVRAMLLEEGRVLLVKHTYLPGWYLPGGGVEAGETFADALSREIAEEAGAKLTAEPQLFGIYRNTKVDRRDHVALFVCRDWEQAEEPPVPNREIAALRRFPVDALPDDATPATRARLGEVLAGAARAVDW